MIYLLKCVEMFGINCKYDIYDEILDLISKKLHFSSYFLNFAPKCVALPVMSPGK